MQEQKRRLVRQILTTTIGNWDRPTHAAECVVKALAWRMLADSVTYTLALQWLHDAEVASRFVREKADSDDTYIWMF